jgi:hypothetical protein
MKVKVALSIAIGKLAAGTAGTALSRAAKAWCCNVPKREG